MLANAGINILGLTLRWRRPIDIIVSRRVFICSLYWFSTAVQTNCVDESPVNAANVFQRWGFSEDEISQIFKTKPAMVTFDVNLLRAKLKTLHDIGFCSSDLVKIITRCPRFFSLQLDNALHERAQFLDHIFGSRQNLLRVLGKNPSMFKCDIEKHIKPCIALYESVGVSQSDLSSLIRARPTLIMRSHLNDEKINCINRFCLSRESKLYKYLVSIIAVSRLETIYGKIENLQKFGFSFEEVMSMLGRFPLILTMSVDTVQRNMTHVIGTMKLPANVVLANPKLLCWSLDRVLKPRFRLGEKIKIMGLKPQIHGTMLMRAFRMKESEFVRFFITCHEEEIAACLMDYYYEAKGFKRLGETPKFIIGRRFF